MDKQQSGVYQSPEIDSHIVTFADDLELLLRSVLTADMFRARYRNVNVPAEIDVLMAWVQHFLDDADIRGRDSEYRQMQEREMETLIAHLRAGRLEAASRVTFLGPSDDAV